MNKYDVATRLIEIFMAYRKHYPGSPVDKEALCMALEAILTKEDTSC